MNVLEEMKRMVDEFVIESEEFIRRMTVCRFESGLLHESLAKEYHNI